MSHKGIIVMWNSGVQPAVGDELRPVKYSEMVEHKAMVNLCTLVGVRWPSVATGNVSKAIWIRLIHDVLQDGLGFFRLPTMPSRTYWLPPYTEEIASDHVGYVEIVKNFAETHHVPLSFTITDGMHGYKLPAVIAVKRYLNEVLTELEEASLAEDGRRPSMLIRRVKASDEASYRIEDLDELYVQEGMSTDFLQKAAERIQDARASLVANLAETAARVQACRVKYRQKQTPIIPEGMEVGSTITLIDSLEYGGVTFYRGADNNQGRAVFLAKQECPAISELAKIGLANKKLENHEAKVWFCSTLTVSSIEVGLPLTPIISALIGHFGIIYNYNEESSSADEQ